MSERNIPTYETTPESLIRRLDDLGLDYPSYAERSLIHAHTTNLYLDAVTGQRIVISAAEAGTQPTGQFFQELCMTVIDHGSDNQPSSVIDFNYSEYGDGLLRKRTTGAAKGFIVVLPGDEIAVDRNNQPVTALDVREAMGYLDGAFVLDPNAGFSRVATLAVD